MPAEALQFCMKLSNLVPPINVFQVGDTALKFGIGCHCRIIHIFY